jgi:hypothetical protein
LHRLVKVGNRLMNSYRPNHCLPQILLTFLVALSILFAGMRVPDLSRPHRPKASQRIVLKSQHKTFSHQLNEHKDFAAALPKPLAAGSTASYHVTSPAAPALYVSLLTLPNPGRSPPAPKG